MNSEIIERDGKLFILDPWQNHFSQPIKYRLAWPTGIFAKDWPNYVGKTVRANGNGTYRFDNGLFLRLEHGGDTKPSQEYSEERRIPRPPIKKNTEMGAGVCNVRHQGDAMKDQHGLDPCPQVKAGVKCECGSNNTVWIAGLPMIEANGQIACNDCGRTWWD